MSRKAPPRTKSLVALEQDLIAVGEQVGAPDPMAMERARRELVDARLAAGRKAMLDPDAAELLGLDPSSALLAQAIRREFDALAAEETPGAIIDRDVLDTCLSAIAGGVTESSLELAFAEALSGAGGPEAVIGGLELLEASLDLVRRAQLLRAAEAAPEAEAMARSIQARWGEEPPVRVRTLAEVLLVTNASAHERARAALARGEGDAERLNEALSVLASANAELRALLDAPDLVPLSAELEGLLVRSRHGAELAAQAREELVPEAPSPENAARLRAWQADLPALASRALYFLYTAAPGPRALAARRMSADLAVPVAEVLGAAERIAERSPGEWVF